MSFNDCNIFCFISRFKRNRKKAETWTITKPNYSQDFRCTKSWCIQKSGSKNDSDREIMFVEASRVHLTIHRPPVCHPPTVEHRNEEAFQIVMQFDNKIWLSQIFLQHFPPIRISRNVVHHFSVETKELLTNESFSCGMSNIRPPQTC